MAWFVLYTVLVSFVCINIICLYTSISQHNMLCLCYTLEIKPTDVSEKRCYKLIQFHTNHRPAYFGTWRKKSRRLNPRNPFQKDEVGSLSVSFRVGWTVRILNTSFLVRTVIASYRYTSVLSPCRLHTYSHTLTHTHTHTGCARL